MGLLLSFETSLLFFQSLAPLCILSFVFSSIDFIHRSKFFLPVYFVGLSLQTSLLFLFGQSCSGSFELSHPGELLTFLDLPQAILFICGFTTSFFFGSLGLESQLLGLSELGAAFSLSLRLLIALFLNLLAQGFFLLFLLLDDRQVVIIVFFLFDAGLLAICLFIILSVNRSVVLVLATTAFAALSLTMVELIIFFDLSGEHVTLLAVDLFHEVLFTLVTLHCDFVDSWLNLGLSVDVVFETTDHIFSGELVVTIILLDRVW